jgi:hypothetical protein
MTSRREAGGSWDAGFLPGSLVLTAPEGHAGTQTLPKIRPLELLRGPQARCSQMFLATCRASGSCSPDPQSPQEKLIEVPSALIPQHQ